MDHFMNEIIDEILQFWSFFRISQNVSHLILSSSNDKSAEKYLNKVIVTK